MQGKKGIRLSDQVVMIRVRLLIAGAMLVGACASNKLGELIVLFFRAFGRELVR